MAKSKTTAKKPTKAKPKVKASPKAAKPKKRVIKSAKLKSHQNKFSSLNDTAFALAYQDGKKGNTLGSSKRYYKEASKDLFK